MAQQAAETLDFERAKKLVDPGGSPPNGAEEQSGGGQSPKYVYECERMEINSITIAKYRVLKNGKRRKVNELTRQGPILMFADEDAEDHEWGKALERTINQTENAVKAQDTPLDDQQ